MHLSTVDAEEASEADTCPRVLLATTVCAESVAACSAHGFELARVCALPRLDIAQFVAYTKLRPARHVESTVEVTSR